MVFDPTRPHERDGPERFLADFRGQLQADGYRGYDALYTTGRVREVGCWAHRRRRFIEALTIATRAALLVAPIQQLYDIERSAADLMRDAPSGGIRAAAGPDRRRARGS